MLDEDFMNFECQKWDDTVYCMQLKTILASCKVEPIPLHVLFCENLNLNLALAVHGLLQRVPVGQNKKSAVEIFSWVL
jgi:hypothetical protein